MKRILTSIAICISAYGFTADLNGRVERVIDGNTIEFVTEEEEVLQVQLEGVDAPELGQKYGEEAKAFLEKIALRKRVTVEVLGKDRWGNRQARVILRSGKCVASELVKSGLAWVRNSEDRRELELEAKEEGRGLWGDADPKPPWIYRREMTMREAKSS